MTHYQAIVVGGGLTGSAAAIALAQAGLDTLHLAPRGQTDRRTSALMMPSVGYLQHAGLIGDPAELGNPLTQIRIIDATNRLIRAPETLFDAREAGMDAFGWNFANAKLLDRFETLADGLPKLTTMDLAVRQIARDDAVHVLTLSDGSTVACDLLIGADGKNSLVRSALGFKTSNSAFEQAALVCDLELARPIGSTSIEFHYPNGPFTLVPPAAARQIWFGSTGSKPLRPPARQMPMASPPPCWSVPSACSAPSRC